MASRKGGNIKIAVRVRQFTKREVGEKRIVEANDNVLWITEKGKERSFQFDRVFWSHDGFTKDSNGYYRKSSKDSRYAEQKTIYDELGKDLLENAFNGYNCSIFAYGQTGSGKSYTMMGEDPNKGLIPLFCEKLFERIEDAENDVTYQVSFSMLEIYKEEIRDLLASGDPTQNILKIGLRRDDINAFCAVGLKEVPVNTSKDVNKWIDVGNQKKSRAQTQMNEQSSRSHTIAAVTLKQSSPNSKTIIESEIKLVDLAGSENSKTAGTSGTRLAEAKKINQSLLYLGMVIETLCKASPNTDVKSDARTHINNSVLTKLMKNSFGGNCKTIMIATISPGQKTSATTLSTLHYASKAGNIKNDARINEVDKIQQCQVMIENKEAELRRVEKRAKTPASEQEIQNLKKEIEELKRKKDFDEQHWKRELEKAKKDVEEKYTYDAKIKSLDCPHLVNISEDPQLSHRIWHEIPQDSLKMVGSNKNKDHVDIVLYGPSIAYNHATLRNTNGRTNLTVIDGTVKLSGRVLEKHSTVEVHHLQPILFGDNYASGLYLYVGGKGEDRNKQHYPLFDDCVNEISKGDRNDENADQHLKARVTVLNGYCLETNKIGIVKQQGYHFQALVLSSLCVGIDSNRMLEYVKGTCDEKVFYIKEEDFYEIHGNVWEYNDLYPSDVELQNGKSFHNVEDLVIPPSKPTRFGIAILSKWADTTKLYSKRVPIYDFNKNTIGQITIETRTCDEEGNTATIVSKPKVSKNFFFQLSIKKAEFIHTDMTGFALTWCEYIFPATDETYRTEEVTGHKPDYNFNTIIGMEEATPLFVQTVKEDPFLIQLWGRYNAEEGEVAQPIHRILREENDKLKEENERLREENYKLKKEIERLPIQLESIEVQSA